mmetsp:Transcript_43715/g.114909  ORF Transcript_43715/g.114909 Transcript_43715/m.114909 type:complete len:247 (+) Transcript_43715:108-848(+)
MVQQVATKQEFDAILAKNAASSTTTFVDFTATWCGPCQRIGPVFEALAKEFPHATFIKVDVDENQETAQECGIRAMPTFKAYGGGKQIAELTGADEAGLRGMCQQHAGSKFAGEGNRLGGGGEASGMSEREKRLAALERRGLGGGAGGSAAVSPSASSPAPAPAPVPAPAHALAPAPVATTAAVPVERAPVIPPTLLPQEPGGVTDPYADALEQLNAMGFSDATANRTVLEAADGDIERALAMLVE